MLNDLQITLEEEQAAKRDSLEAQKQQEIERLKVELEEELHAERRRLQGEREEKLSSLKQEVIETVLAYLDPAHYLFILFSFVFKFQISNFVSASDMTA